MLFRSPSVRLVVVLVAATLVLAMELARHPAAPGPAQAVVPVTQVDGKPVRADALHRIAQGAVPMPEGTTAAHASSLLTMPPGQAAALTLFWFSGERESGPLVQIAASQWDRASQAWLPPRFVVNRHSMGDQLGYGLRRLGNPVAWMDGRGRIHLFVVATGWGGWAASRILHLRQSSVGQGLQELAFEPVDVLPLSWLWNISYLVRNAPLPLQDGGMVLPVHFELGWKHPAALRFDADGNFKGMVRMSSHHYALQPTLLAQTPTQWLALLRDERLHGKVGAARSDDGGQHWTDLPDLALDNPDASVGAMALGADQLLLLHNSSPGTRARLDLSRSANGIDWTLQQTLEHGKPEDEFSYPAMAWADGNLWVSYTVDRQRLAWQRFAPGTAPGAAPAVGSQP